MHIVQWQQRLLAERYQMASAANISTVLLGTLGRIGASAVVVRLGHLATVFGLKPWRAGKAPVLSCDVWNSAQRQASCGADVKNIYHSASPADDSGLMVHRHSKGLHSSCGTLEKDARDVAHQFRAIFSNQDGVAQQVSFAALVKSRLEVEGHVGHDLSVVAGRQARAGDGVNTNGVANSRRPREAVRPKSLVIYAGDIAAGRARAHRVDGGVETGQRTLM